MLIAAILRVCLIWVTAVPCILVVEDDADVQAVVIEFLQATGYQVLSAASAEEARHVLACASVDLALIDCVMSREQGDSLAEHASRLGIPTILTSGDPHYLETSSEQSLPFLAKPFRLAALEELISLTLVPSSSKPGAGEPRRVAPSSPATTTPSGAIGRQGSGSSV
jgi:DNA-binding NtrC family response regulator